MDNTLSVSKGVFAFKNGLKSKRKQKTKSRNDHTEVPSGNIFSDELWYHSFNKLWNKLEKKILDLNDEMFANVLSNLIEYVKTSYDKPVSEIPVAALLTGINMPDQTAQFVSLAKELKKNTSQHVAVLNSQDCPNIKTFVEHLTNLLVNDDVHSDEEGEMEIDRIHVKKSQCSFAVLQAWYEDLNYSDYKRPVVVIFEDFESLQPSFLSKMIQISSSYVNSIPFVFVFGVATSVSALHSAMPYHVFAKINLKIFKSQPSIKYLNSILENVFLKANCPFHLGGKIFSLFTDIFLFYDLSVTGFIQNFKYAMFEHFGSGNAQALCIKQKSLHKVLNQFTHDDYESVRHLPSFRKLVESESNENIVQLFESDDYLRDVIIENTSVIYDYLKDLHVLLKCLLILVEDLPNAPLGKQIRELYNLTVSTDLVTSEEFKEAFKMLNFQSKHELEKKVDKIVGLIENNCENEDIFKTVEELKIYFANGDEIIKEDVEETDDINLITEKMGRQQLKDTLLKRSKQNVSKTKYEQSRAKLLTRLQSMFEKYLVQPEKLIFHEIFFFNDVSIRNNIMGIHRAAIHTALNEPKSYLDCKCCPVNNKAIILNTMPDLCIAYKLHLEYGKMINLYDWLQAFSSILIPANHDNDEKEEENKVDPEIQARFTQCVAELEFLGFIKSSKRKADHVTRLTWGG